MEGDDEMTTTDQIETREVIYRLVVQLTNEDKGVWFSKWDEELADWLLTDDGQPDTGAIFRECQREYGRCMSSVYVDQKNGPPKRVGWFFVGRQRYEDTGEPYLRGAWVSIIATKGGYVGLS